jgi:phosphatidylglycerol---prolipoprotein diacylglyceryl transferase
MGGFLAFLLSRATGLEAFVFLEAGYLLLGLLGLAVVAWGVSRQLVGQADRSRYLLVLALAVPVGMAGARIIPIVQDGFAAGRLTWGLVRSGGLVFYGGFLTGLAAMGLGCRLWHRSPWPLLDAVCRFSPLGHAFGRLGCFFGGCCFGAPTDSILGVRFPAGSPAYLQHKAQGLLAPGAVASLPVHPSQLYETVGNLLLFFLLDAVARGKTPPPPGRLTTLYLTGYALLRFVLEFWRGDDIRGLYYGLSTSQYLALAVAAGGLVILWRAGHRPATAGAFHPR